MRKISLFLLGTALFLLGLSMLVPVASAQQGRTVAILMPGKGGAIPGDFLVRNRGRFNGAGIETRVTTSPAEAAEIARSAKQKGRKVVIVGMSMGALHAGQALAAGAPANGVVFVSGVLRGAMSALGSPAKLPPTLIVHHQNDACEATLPADARAFQQWSGGRARVVWINTQAGSAPPAPAGIKPAIVNAPCAPYHAAHGFYMQDGPAVSAIVGLIRSR